MINKEYWTYAALGGLIGGLAGTLLGRSIVPDFVPKPEVPNAPDNVRIVTENAFGPGHVSEERSGYAFTGSLIGFLALPLIAGLKRS